MYVSFYMTKMTDDSLLVEKNYTDMICITLENEL